MMIVRREWFLDEGGGGSSLIFSSSSLSTWLSGHDEDTVGR